MLAERIQKKVLETNTNDLAYTPCFFRLSKNDDKVVFEKLLTDWPYIKIFDTIYSQLRELVKTRKPSLTLTDNEIKEGVHQHLSGVDITEYGVWVYYPWSERIVHILDEQEFIEMRTNRNKYKITESEQLILAGKKVGVIGLSVGQSVSLTMAMERTFGELRIADYDELEITNLNRLRSSVHNMGLAKTILVAREIAEIDPYLKVTCFHEGITGNNIESFILENGKLDILIDECDSVDIKINCRVAAKKHGVPVLMEASDRGTIDIERFDLEPSRPILHGYIDHLDISQMKGLKSMEEKLPYILPIVGIETMSTRLKASAVEVGQTISTWPQLASAVTMGGGITADVCRRVLLDQLHVSGRYFIDLEELISDPVKAEKHFILPEIEPLTSQIMQDSALLLNYKSGKKLETNFGTIEKLVKAAQLAPSAGNMQPWKWYFDGIGLYLFHDRERSAALADFRNMTSKLSFGTAIEHIYLVASGLQLEVETKMFPLGEENAMVAVFWFSKNENVQEDLLAEYISYRRTNRNPGNGKKIDAEILQDLKTSVSPIEGARIKIVDNAQMIQSLADIAGKADKLRIFIEEGHFDLFNKELKFSMDAPDTIKEGLDVRTLDLKPKDQVGFRVIKDLKAIKLISEWNGGAALETVSHDQVASSAATAIITMPGFDTYSMINAGRAAERVWLTATSRGLAFQPLLASVLHFARILQGGGEGIPKNIQNEFMVLHSDFVKIFGIKEGEIPLFFMRLCYAAPPKLIAQRLDMESIFCFKY